MASSKDSNPLLVPVDFSADSEAALVYASELATLLRTPLLVLHVVHDPGEAPGYYSVKGRRKHMRKLEDVAGDMLKQFMQEVSSRNPKMKAIANAKTKLVTGLPVNRILEVADKAKAGMIVMGSQGRTGLAHALVGSKAEQVVRLARIPVTIVKSDKATKGD
jgi:nucleotide-binding universal stress UspA family protein